MTIGFVGQGFVGKSMADDFEARGFSVMRYALEKEYIGNKDKISLCEIVFVCVPTPTTKEGFDYSIVEGALSLVGKGNTAVVKSTVLPGTTKKLQEKFPEIFVLMSPEFLTASQAAFDASYPKRNIIGIPSDTEVYKQKAEEVLAVLPFAPYKKICGSTDAELIKYGRNTLGYVRVIYVNMLYDLVEKMGADWGAVREAMVADPDNGPTYMNPIHRSGRGAGGACFIKDFAAFRELYEEVVGDSKGVDILKSLEAKNIDLLVKTKKDFELLKGVYGDSIVDGK